MMVGDTNYSQKAQLAGLDPLRKVISGSPPDIFWKSKVRAKFKKKKKMRMRVFGISHTMLFVVRDMLQVNSNICISQTSVGFGRKLLLLSRPLG